MTICDGCGKEVGNLYCGRCRAKIEEKTKVKPDKLIPLLFWDTEENCYRFGCTCSGCPCNQDGVCGMKNLEPLGMLKTRMHPFDGDNIIHQACG